MTDEKYSNTVEMMLWVHAIYFIKMKKKVKIYDFPNQLLSYLQSNNLLSDGDKIQSIEEDGTRNAELKMEQKIRNLISHKSLFSRGYVEVEDGWYRISGSILPCFESVFRLPEVSFPPKTEGKTNSHISNFRIVISGPPGTGKTRVAKRIAAYLFSTNGTSRDEAFNISKIANIVTYIEERAALWLPSFAAHTTILQVHPSFAYEDFIEGIRPFSLPNGQVAYGIKDGPLKIAAKKLQGKVSMTGQFSRVGDESFFHPAFPSMAIAPLEGDCQIQIGSVKYLSDETGTSRWRLKLLNSNQLEDLPSEALTIAHVYHDWGQQHVIILDEINRGKVSSFFGELLFAIADIDDSIKDENGKYQAFRANVRLQYSGEEFFWPSGLHLIGTMNSADRSVDDIDQALRRRFQFVDFSPDYSTISELPIESIARLLVENPNKLKSNKGIQGHNVGSVDSLFQWLVNSNSTPSAWLKQVNQKILADRTIYKARDRLLGQSFLLKWSRKAAEIALLSTDDDDFNRRAVVASVLMEGFRTEIIPTLESVCSGDPRKLNKLICSEESVKSIDVPIDSVKELFDDPWNQIALISNLQPLEEIA